MADHNLDGVQMPQLEETTYDPSKAAVKHSLDDIAVPVLEETSYTPPSQKKSDLSDVAMPTLSDTYTQNQAQQPQFQQYGAPAQAQTQQPQFQQYGAPAQTQVQQPQFQQYGAPAQTQVQQPQFQQYGAPAQTQAQQPQFQQYGAPAQTQAQQPQFQQYGAPAQTQAQQPQFQQYGTQAQTQAQQPQYQQYGAQAQTPAQNNHTLDDVQKPMLEDEPPVQQRYVPKYVDPDIENAKKASVDRAIKSSLNSVPDSFDQEKSREMYREFMREKESDMAKKGAVTVVILAILTILSGALSFFFATGPLTEKTAEGFMDTLNMLYMIMAFVQILGAVLMFVKSQNTQKAASTIVTLITVLMVIPGIFIYFSKESRGNASIFYFIPLIINIIVCFIFGSSENIKKHYNGHEIDSY